MFSKFLYDISKLDSTFYEKVNSAFQAMIDLRHLYDSLVDHEDTAKITKINIITFGFSSYALRETERIEKELKDLFFYCTEKELTEGLLR